MLLKTIFQSMRPPFLLLPLMLCLLIYSLASFLQVEIDPFRMSLIIIASLLAHISVNMLNEYQDFSSGLDLETNRTPFSGGSGALPAYPSASPWVLRVSLLVLLITCGIGFYLMLDLGWKLLLPGLLGVIIILAYTRWINRLPWLCLFAPGTGFGLLMVAGGYYALVGSSNSLVFWVSLVPFFLVNNLLLLNQYPDIDADRKVGRNHFLIRYGVMPSNGVYLVFLLSAFVIIAGLILIGQLPVLAWIAVFPVILGLLSFSGALKQGDQIGSTPHYLAANVGVTLLTPLLLSVSLFFA